MPLLPYVLTAALAVQGTPCDPTPQGLAPSADLYCVDLSPAPGIAGVDATLALQYPAGPFTLPVTADGRIRYRPILALAGLPDPASFGPYRTYVAWVAPPAMHPLQPLGPVANGVTTLPEIALDKFVLLVTAEPAPDVAERSGRLVLRGISPSMRMRPPDFLEFGLGAVPPGAATRNHATHGHDSHEPGSAPAWTTVPMPAGLTMLPAEMALEPQVTPRLPHAGDVPDARPRELLELDDGDTLRLEAGLVRRRIHGRTYTMYGFNGQYPGPLLQISQHAEITIVFTNAIDLPSTIHWHGVRLDNRFDGVPHLTQPPVAPGERFVYRVRFPDAGIYWYHPHVREDVQQDLGLYGNMLVRSPHADWYGPAHREELLMLDDLLIGDAGLVPYGGEGATHALMGRFGNVMLVNGEPEWRLDARRGEVIRLFLTNVSNARTFNLSLPGARMKVVGSDVGNYVREAWIESIVIAPAERYVVHVRFDAPGEVPLINSVRATDHLYGRFFQETDTLGSVRVADDPVQPDLSGAFSRLREDQRAVADLAPLRRHFDRPVDRELVLSLEVGDLPFITRQLMQLDSVYFHPVEWSGTMPMMNWASTTRQVRWVLRDPRSNAENMAIDTWRFRVGDVIKLRLLNQRESLHAMPHPIHIHGQRFLVLAVNDVPNEHLVWKDTALLPVGATVDILLELSNPGRWMLHCHIAEHIEAGMMMVFEVEEP